MSRVRGCREIARVRVVHAAGVSTGAALVLILMVIEVPVAIWSGIVFLYRLCSPAPLLLGSSSNLHPHARLSATCHPAFPYPSPTAPPFHFHASSSRQASVIAKDVKTTHDEGEVENWVGPDWHVMYTPGRRCSICSRVRRLTKVK